jgi:hypothetical protein
MGCPPLAPRLSARRRHGPEATAIGPPSWRHHGEGCGRSKRIYRSHISGGMNDPRRRSSAGPQARHLRLAPGAARRGAGRRRRRWAHQPARLAPPGEIEELLGRPSMSARAAASSSRPQGRRSPAAPPGARRDRRGRARDRGAGAGPLGPCPAGRRHRPALDRVLPRLRAARLALPQVSCEVEVAPSDPLATSSSPGGSTSPWRACPRAATPPSST